MKLLLAIFPVLLSLLSHAQEPERIPAPKPYPVEDEQVELKRVPMVVDSDLKDKLTRLGAEDLKTKYQGTIPADHEAYLIMIGGEGKVIPNGQWIVYDLTEKELISYVAPSLELQLHATPDLNYIFIPRQVSLRATIVSVKRNADPFVVWTDDLIKSHDPQDLAFFSVMARSGEKAECAVDVPSKGKHILDIEAIIGEDLKIVDATLHLSLLPTDANSGIDLKTSMTLANGKPLIHPIGISTESDRIYILKMIAEIVDVTGKKLPAKDR